MISATRLHALLHVIKAPAIPKLMISTCAVMKEASRRSIEHVDAIENVLATVAVHQIKQDCQSVLVCFVDQGLQLFRRTETAGRCEEACHLISKTSVVRMFHNGHQLNSIVSYDDRSIATRSLDHRQTLLDNARNNVQTKVLVGRDRRFRRTDAHVSFVDLQTVSFLRLRVFKLVLFVVRWVVENGVVDVRLLIALHVT